MESNYTDRHIRYFESQIQENDRAKRKVEGGKEMRKYEKKKKREETERGGEEKEVRKRKRRKRERGERQRGRDRKRQEGEGIIWKQFFFS